MRVARGVHPPLEMTRKIKFPSSSIVLAAALTALSAVEARAQTAPDVPPPAAVAAPPPPAAIAAPPPPAAIAAPPPPAAVAAPPPPAARDAERPTTAVAAEAPAAAVAADPNIDRAFLQPTAMTQPRGTFTYNNYELLLHGLSYGVTDNLQVSLTVLSPITTDIPFLGIASIKWRVQAAERLHLALQGSLTYVHSFNSSDSGDAFSFGVGAYASVCLREDCSSLLSATVNYQLAVASDSSGHLNLLIYGGSIVHRVSNHVKLLAEITTAAGQSDTSGLDNIPGFLFSYGVRFFTGSVAGDIGFIKPVGDSGNDGLLLGIPFVSVSYRW